MSLPLFDANVYPHADLSSGAFPQQRAGNRWFAAGSKSDRRITAEAKIPSSEVLATKFPESTARVKTQVLTRIQ